MYIFDIKKLFLKISFELPKPSITKEKHQPLLHAIGGGWYMKKLSQNIQPLKKRKPSKRAQEKENKIKIKLYKDNQDWNDWKFQIHWNKLEWVNQRSRCFVCHQIVFI